MSKLAAPLLLPAVLSVIRKRRCHQLPWARRAVQRPHHRQRRQMVAGQAANIALLLSVPMFVLVFALTTLLAALLERAGFATGF